MMVSSMRRSWDVSMGGDAHTGRDALTDLALNADTNSSGGLGDCNEAGDYHQLGRLVSESVCERKDPDSNPAADMVDAARNTAWDLADTRDGPAEIEPEDNNKTLYSFTKHKTSERPQQQNTGSVLGAEQGSEMSSYIRTNINVVRSVVEIAVPVNRNTAIFYLMIFLLYCISAPAKHTVRRQIICLLAAMSTISYYALLSNNDFETVKFHMGLLSCLGSIVFCASPLTSVVEVIRTKSTTILPFPLITLMFLSAFMWTLYGHLIDVVFVIIPNFLCAVISSIQLMLFFIYPSSSSDTKAIICCKGETQII
ncbi:SWEET sugar transporter [Trinorchestia longiramus]|nr:SWEET sugar transporter [Trinorchestia longiramus]